MTSAEFKILYPAFAPTADTWVTTVLAQSEVQVADSWDAAERDDIVGLTAAATLARSPQGRAAQLVSKDGSSVYSRELDERRHVHACAYARLW